MNRQGSTPLATLLILLLPTCFTTDNRHPDIQGSATCDSCDIDVQVVWASGHADSNVMGTASPVELGDTLWLMGETFGHAIARFPLDGESSSLISRKGKGPGEFHWIDAARAHPAGDTIVIFQDDRISYVTTALREARSFRNPVHRSVGVTVLPDGSIVFAAHRVMEPASAAGRVLHHFSNVGQYLGSFGNVDQPYDAGLWPMAAGAQPFTIWVLQPRVSGFTAELWNVPERRLLRTIAVNPSWWVAESRTPEEYESMAGKRAVVPQLPTGTVGVWQGKNVLWVALRHYDMEHQRSSLNKAQVHEQFDGVLLALDLQTGRVVTTRVFDEFLLGFTGRGKLVMLDDYSDGNPRVQLAEVEVGRRN